MAFGDLFRLTLLTRDPRLAEEGDSAGVDRIGVDLECVGKADRQAGQDGRASGHTFDDLAGIAPMARRADLFVRINPWHAGSQTEIDAALELGAKVVMLPYFRTAEEVERFVSAIRGRAVASILIETATALARIRRMAAVLGVGEVMVGLNDLHRELRLSNHFEALASPLLDVAAAESRRAGLPFGVGGLGRVDDPGLPVDGDLVYAQYPRLGATGAWIARSFLTAMRPGEGLGDAVAAARRRLTEWSLAGPEALEEARDELARRAAAWTRT